MEVAISARIAARITVVIITGGIEACVDSSDALSKSDKLTESSP